MSKQVQNIPGLKPSEVEFFTTNFTDLYAARNGKSIEFKDFPAAYITLLINVLNETHLIPERLVYSGIFDIDDQLRQCGICRFGGYNERPDYNFKTGRFEESEYFECGHHNNCPFNLEGILCQQIKLPNGSILTPSELLYLKYTCLDLADKEIAALLNISENTIKKHRQNITKKLEVNSKVGIAVFACDRGIKFPDHIANKILTKRGGRMNN